MLSRAIPENIGMDIGLPSLLRGLRVAAFTGSALCRSGHVGCEQRQL